MSGTMTSRERVLRTFRFQETDRVPLDFLDGVVWPAAFLFFAARMGLKDLPAVWEHFDTDLRWFRAAYSGPALGTPGAAPLIHVTYSDSMFERPLRDATTAEEALARYPWPDPAWWDASGAPEFRKEWPAHAVALHVGWQPLFCNVCNAFGFANALERMLGAPEIFAAVLERQNRFLVALLERVCSQAEGCADVCCFGDDYADQRGLIMGPDLWRRFIKEPLRRQADVAHRHGMFTLLHSCGSVREILPDLIEIGIDCLQVFQTTAAGMDPESIARDFGGKIVFFGGIDCQSVLSYGSPEETRREVRRNIDAFAQCGGYIVSNAHVIDSIQPANLAAMLEEARDYRPRRAAPLGRARRSKRASGKT
jgi:uroporphyrinogen decarboxylase